MRRLVFFLLPLIILSGCLKKQTLKQEEILQPAPLARSQARPDTAADPLAAAVPVFAPVHFEYDSSRVGDDAMARLIPLSDTLRKYPGLALRIEGHCDERGGDGYNFALGGKRALAVRDVLVSRGIEKSRLFPVSLGRERPADLNGTEAAFARNRRVEFMVMPDSARP